MSFEPTDEFQPDRPERELVGKEVAVTRRIAEVAHFQSEVARLTAEVEDKKRCLSEVLATCAKQQQRIVNQRAEINSLIERERVSREHYDAASTLYRESKVSYERLSARFTEQEARIAELEAERKPDDYDRTFHTEFVNGQEAFESGKSREENPHVPLTLKHDAWDNGWIALAYDEKIEGLIRRIAELERELVDAAPEEAAEKISALRGDVETLTARNAELTADLKTHMHLVRTMGERCGLLTRLLERGLKRLKDVPGDLPLALWIDETERALAQQETRG